MSATAEAPRQWSLRRTLLGILLSLTVGIWSISAVLVYLDADRESRELFDQSLAETAHILLSLAEHEFGEGSWHPAHRLGESTAVDHQEYLLFQIWSADGRLLYKNSGAPDTPFRQQAADGFSWLNLQSSQWRHYSVWNQRHTVQIQVVEPISHRKEISSRFAYRLAALALLIIPLLVLAIWWAVNRVFRSLQHYASQVSQRHPGDLQPLSAADAPMEINPLLHALNRLFERVAQTLQREQRFTADAAHELRTPLAGLKTNLQVLQRARNPEESAEAIAGLRAGVERASRLVAQLMSLARSEPESHLNAQHPACDLAANLQSVCRHWQAEAEAAGLVWQQDLQQAWARVDAAELHILVRNLLENALRYTPVPGQLRLSCGSHAGRAWLEVEDSGPGIPEQYHEQVLQRFFRLAGADQPGSGLGLSIVKNIADAHAASLQLSAGSHGQGLRVRLEFPAWG